VSERASASGREAFDAAANRLQLVEVRCKFAETARREAEAAQAKADKASRVYEAQLTAFKAAQAADPVTVGKLKEDAHEAFRKSIQAARSRDQIEEAASVWLVAINRINATSRSSMIRLHREREALEGLADELDRLMAQAEAAAAMADAAEEACRSARESLAATKGSPPTAASAEAARSALAELAAAQATAHAAFAAPTKAEPPPPAILRPVSIGRTAPAAEPEGSVPSRAAPAPPSPPEPAQPVNYRAPDPPALVRALRGEGPAVAALVQRLAGPDAEQRRSWQACLSGLVSALVDAAADQGYYIFPRDHPFWGQFTLEQARELARGLAALGFRYDGQDGFIDDRVPGPRDLTLAAGNAGLPTVRVRYWPTLEEAAFLYRGVRVDATQALVEQVPTGTMNELMQLVGRRSQTLSELWNEWPRVRPLLFGGG
jgi:hypothetical protein